MCQQQSLRERRTTCLFNRYEYLPHRTFWRLRNKNWVSSWVRAIWNSFGPMHWHFKCKRPLPVSCLVAPICSVEGDQREEQPQRCSANCSGREGESGQWGGPEQWEREREKRSCFPVLINLGNKSENIAKNGIHCKRLKTVLLIITELPPFNWNVQLELETLYINKINKFAFRERKPNYTYVYEHLKKCYFLRESYGAIKALLL